MFGGPRLFQFFVFLRKAIRKYASRTARARLLASCGSVGSLSGYGCPCTLCSTVSGQGPKYFAFSRIWLRFLMIVLQVIIACLLAETRAIATRCVRGDDVLQVVCLHGHGCTL